MTQTLELSDVVFENIRERRTVPYQRMSSDPIAEEHIARILEAGNWAPSHKHTEPWYFYVFRGEGRKTLVDVLDRSYRSYCSDDFKEKKHEKIVTRPLHVPLIIALVMRPGESTNPRHEDILAVGAAAQNMQLVARSLGIVNSWSTPNYRNDLAMKTFFEIGEKDLHCGFFYMGYCMEDKIPRSKRRALETKVTHILG